MKITEQFILLQAPNSGAVSNGRKLSASGKFFCHGTNQEQNVFWAQCSGSGKNPYQTSIDFSLDENAPTCRCSCPSRQFPCKHAVGLMFELLAGKDFAECEMPEDLAQKRAKQAAKIAKKDSAEVQEDKPRKVNTSGQKKKLQKQLEGLSMARNMVDDLLNSGIAALAGTSAASFEKIAKELGNFYLTGPQNAFTRIALEVRRIQQNPDQAQSHYAEALRILIQLHATIKKGESFLQAKLDNENFSAENSLLYEAMGGIWRLEDLKAIGSYRENAKLIQLSFDVSLDEARKEYVDRGFWIDPDRGCICQTLNYRPLKALKYVKSDDSCFDLLEIPTIYEYPGDLNRRVRWEGCATREITSSDLALLLSHASGIAESVKLAKNQMKNTLLPKFIPALIRVERIGKVGETLVLEDPDGSRIQLRNRAAEGADHDTLRHVSAIAEAGSGALFGLVFYDEADHRICLHPYSFVTAEKIIRLHY